MASLNVTSDLAYQAAVLGWMNPPDPFKLLAQMVTSEKSPKSAGALETVSGTAVWYHSGLAPAPIRWVLVRDPSGEREPQAFLSTDLDAAPAEILGWFVQRWSMETTFQETRDHLGVEMQRQWSDLAIARSTVACRHTTPATRASSSGLQDQ